MPGLAKCGRRADMSGVMLGDGLGEIVGDAREEPEMRRGCSGRFPGSSGRTGTGITQGGKKIRGRKRERERTWRSFAKLEWVAVE